MNSTYCPLRTPLGTSPAALSFVAVFACAQVPGSWCISLSVHCSQGWVLQGLGTPGHWWDWCNLLCWWEGFLCMVQVANPLTGCPAPAVSEDHHVQPPVHNQTDTVCHTCCLICQCVNLLSSALRGHEQIAALAPIVRLSAGSGLHFCMVLLLIHGPLVYSPGSKNSTGYKSGFFFPPPSFFLRDWLVILSNVNRNIILQHEWTLWLIMWLQAFYLCKALGHFCRNTQNTFQRIK